MKAGPRRAIAVLVALLAAGAGAWFQHHRSSAMVEGAVAADPLLAVEFFDLEGQPRRLDAWQGKLLAINFWATWCPPCRKEMPAFMRLQDRYGPQGLQFIGIALDSREDVAKFVAEHGLRFPIFAGEEDVARYMQRLGNTIGALPFTVLVDHAGVVRHTHQGEWPEAAAEAVIKSYLEAP